MRVIFGGPYSGKTTASKRNKHLIDPEQTEYWQEVEAEYKQYRNPDTGLLPPSKSEIRRALYVEYVEKLVRSDADGVLLLHFNQRIAERSLRDGAVAIVIPPYKEMARRLKEDTSDNALSRARAGFEQALTLAVWLGGPYNHNVDIFNSFESAYGSIS